MHGLHDHAHREREDLLGDPRTEGRHCRQALVLQGAAQVIMIHDKGAEEAALSDIEAIAAAIRTACCHGRPGGQQAAWAFGESSAHLGQAVYLEQRKKP